MTASPDPLLRIDNLSKSFGDHQVLKDISLEVRHGEVVSIIGASGSGKSTFLRCLNVLETPDQGRLSFENFHFDFRAGSVRQPPRPSSRRCAPASAWSSKATICGRT